MKRLSSPVVIGGLGGSGTRLIASCLRELDYFIGSDLNQANDNLAFTLLFKHIGVLESNESEFEALVNVFQKTAIGDTDYDRHQLNLISDLISKNRPQHSIGWLTRRAYALLSEANDQKEVQERWGWKEPNSHILLDRFLSYFHGMKYIHVVRNGLDMAYSENRNQLKFWGEYFFGQGYELSPNYALKYWCLSNKRVIEIGKSMRGNFLFLDYDYLCLNPQAGIKQLLDFLEISHSEMIVNLSQLIQVPSTIGRFKDENLTLLDPVDIDYVKKLGFDTNQ